MTNFIICFKSKPKLIDYKFYFSVELNTTIINIIASVYINITRSELKLKSKCIIPMCIEIELDNEFKDLFADYLKTTNLDTPIKFEDEDTFNALRDTFIEKFIFGDEWTDYYNLTPTDISEYCYGAFAINDNIIEQFVDFVCNCVLPEFTKMVAKYYKNRIQITRVD